MDQPDLLGEPPAETRDLATKKERLYVTHYWRC